MNFLKPLKEQKMPEVLPLKSLIGPSFILLGMGLGSGELILWPYLSANFGLGIIWAAILGITFQFFINMEIERYTLATGESIFVGLTRKFGRFVPYWFIFTTLLPWLWPGIAASSATLFAAAFGIKYSKYLAIAILLLLGILFSLGRVIYQTQEKVQKLIVIVGVPFILLITLYLTKASDWQILSAGIIGKGEGFWFLPRGLPLATFLAALAYAGAGGNLNLAQSLYIKEKGYGMAKYAGHITNIFNKKQGGITLEGFDFIKNKRTLKEFYDWWKIINLEHALVFWLTGAFTMLLLSLLAYSTVFKSADVETSINFVIYEAGVISQTTFPVLGKFLLIMFGVMLFGTQYSVYGSNSRIAGENMHIISKSLKREINPSKYFYLFLWLQLSAGALMFFAGFTEPLTLVVTGAVLNAFSMFIYSGLVLYTNSTLLDKNLRPSLFRKIMVGLAFMFYGGFSIFTIWQNILKFI